MWWLRNVQNTHPTTRCHVSRQRNCCEHLECRAIVLRKLRTWPAGSETAWLWAQHGGIATTVTVGDSWVLVITAAYRRATLLVTVYTGCHKVSLPKRWLYPLAFCVLFATVGYTVVIVAYVATNCCIPTATFNWWLALNDVMFINR